MPGARAAPKRLRGPGRGKIVDRGLIADAFLDAWIAIREHQTDDIQALYKRQYLTMVSRFERSERQTSRLSSRFKLFEGQKVCATGVLSFSGSKKSAPWAFYAFEGQNELPNARHRPRGGCSLQGPTRAIRSIGLAHRRTATTTVAPKPPLSWLRSRKPMRAPTSRLVADE